MSEADELERLETSLWRADTRFDREYMEAVLAPDFLEFGRSGRTYRRSDTLAVEATNLDVRLRGVRVASVADDVRLVTYVSEVRTRDGLQLANCSSLWVRTGTTWRLRFHQGTPTR